MKDRRRLKGTGISIQEDLTKANHQVLMKLANHPKVEAAWSTDGKIMAALKTNEYSTVPKNIYLAKENLLQTCQSMDSFHMFVQCIFTQIAFIFAYLFVPFLERSDGTYYSVRSLV